MPKPQYLTGVVPDEFLAPFKKLILLGILSMTIAGVIPIPLGIGLAIAFPFLLRLKISRNLEKWAPGVSILFGALYFLFPSILLLVLFTLFFQLLYLWEAKKPVHYFWIAAVGLVHLAVLSTITASVVYPFLFLAYVVVLTHSLLVANFLSGLQEKDQTIDVDELHQTEKHFIDRTKVIGNWIVGISIGIGLLIFPILPRAQTLSYQPTQVTQESVTGFSDEVVLGEMGEIQSDNRVALRVFVPQPYSSRVQRWRGAVLDTWNHKDQGWVSNPRGIDRSENSEDWIYFQGRRIEQSDTLTKPIKVHVSSLGRPVVFTPEINGRSPEFTVGVKGSFDKIMFDSDGWTGTLSEDYAFRTYEYDLLLLNETAAESRGLIGQAWNEGLPKDLLARSLNIETIPMEFIEKLEDRATELIPAYRNEDYDPEGLARDLELALMTSQDYTLDYTKETGAKDLSDFVFNKKAGHCEYFATTLALMLRAKGIPARLVTGFRGGRENFFGDYRIIRQSDAHSWVEAYVEDKGWITLDPTPSSTEHTNSLMMNIGFLVDIYDYIQLQWNRYVLDYSKDNQRDLLDIASRGLGYLSTHLLALRITIANLQNAIAGLLFLVFLVWLLR
ncbi:MAG: DUF3488 domain-containing protein, partial [Candidatus Omnitrophica bacterium]|nr:DUF3488 domain-containing protein [Candidatus Omnitrophota bacterium]